MQQRKPSEPNTWEWRVEQVELAVTELRKDFKKATFAIIGLLLACLGYMITHPLVFPSELHAAGVAQAKEMTPHGGRE